MEDHLGGRAPYNVTGKMAIDHVKFPEEENVFLIGLTEKALQITLIGSVWIMCPSMNQ